MAERPQQCSTSFFVEQMGLLWESEGLPRIAGRIFGLLAIRPLPSSLDDLASALEVSKASISTDARLLEKLGLLDRTTRPGDRRDYYTIAPDAPARMLAFRLEAMGRFATAFDGIRAQPDLHPAVTERLERFERVHHRVVHALTTALTDLREDGRDREHVLLTRTGTL